MQTAAQPGLGIDHPEARLVVSVVNRRTEPRQLHVLRPAPIHHRPTGVWLPYAYSGTWWHRARGCDASLRQPVPAQAAPWTPPGTAYTCTEKAS